MRVKRMSRNNAIRRVRGKDVKRRKIKTFAIVLVISWLCTLYPCTLYLDIISFNSLKRFSLWCLGEKRITKTRSCEYCYSATIEQKNTFTTSLLLHLSKPRTHAAMRVWGDFQDKSVLSIISCVSERVCAWCCKLQIRSHFTYFAMQSSF